MTAPAWSPTQQVRALLLLHETCGLLAAEARACTMHGHPQLAAQLTAVGKRNLPQGICEMADWSALRLAGSREHLRTAVAQYQDSSAWAERLTGEVALLLRQGQRFTDAILRVQEIAQSVAADDEAVARRRFEQLHAAMALAQVDHTAEDADGGRVWSPILERLSRAGSALGVAVVPSQTAAVAARSGGPPAAERVAHSSTPYQPSSATEPGTGTGGSHALRRRH